VGFYFQQRRATLLAAGLKGRAEDNSISSKRICIIGGGMTGLTLLVALHSEGARRLTLYESEDEILKLGSKANHRLLHPTYNRWPMLGSMDPFTSLPHFNWHSDSAEDVIGEIRAHAQADYNDIIRNYVKKNVTCKKLSRGGEILDVTYWFKVSNGLLNSKVNST
jgi:NADPH-dependent 2,4-dienoyl-CoA reductase/sulfur reductase-like enzyme